MDRRILDRFLEDHPLTAAQQHDLLEKNGGTHAVIDHFGVPPGFTGPPFLTGTPFNDAYRYMDWLLTVPLLLMEIVLVMKVPDDEKNQLCFKLGVSSGLMIIMGYPGELLTEQNELSGRWMYWGLSMVPFCYVVYTLLVLRDLHDEDDLH